MSDTADNSQGPRDPRIPRPPEDAKPPTSPTAASADQPTLITGLQGPPPPPAQPQPPQPPAPQPAQQPPWQQQTVRAPAPTPPQPGYGYPQPTPQQPPANGRPGYQQPGYQQPAPFHSSEPDWSALAERQAAEAKRKRRLTVVISSAVAVVLLGGGTAFALGAFKSTPAKPKPAPVAVGTASASATVSTAPSASPSAAPTTTAPPTAKPTRTPPLAAETVFTAKTRQINGKTYTRTATDSTDTCWKATGGGLGDVLSKQNCAQVLRATYVSGTSAVTVGIAVFHDKADAATASQKYVGNLAPLFGAPVDPFCQKAACALTHDVHGRFDYFTVAGPTDNSAGAHDSASTAAAHGFAGYALSRLMTMS